MSQDRELFNDTMLEGEYTTWLPVWQFDIGAAISIQLLAVDNWGTVYACATATNRLWVRTRAGATQALINHRLFVPVYNRSITCKYVAIYPNTLLDRLEIWRYGVEIATLLITLLDPALVSLSGFAISPNGRFVAMSCATGVAVYRYVQLWEGS